MLFFFPAAFLSFFYLQMSQKSSTFALVIELERHIEILLLSNDCVIVPDLGGFMTHHSEARFDDEDNMFLPPLRTLGFNPQLKMNDSLLAQSYIEAYDISYPEAVRRIEAEVAEVKQHLNTSGSYSLNDIGVLSVNEEGKLEFEPCEAGILTPELYGLSSFEMVPLHGAKKHRAKEAFIEETDADEQTPAENKADDEAIIIRMSWVRNTVAVAAALIAFLLMTPRIDNGGQSTVSMSKMSLPIVIKDTATKPAKDLDTQSIKRTVRQNDTTATTSHPATDKVQDEKLATAVVQQTAITPVQTVKEAQPSTVYSIVVASQVSQRNAEAFVEKLRQEGIANVRVHVHNNIRRVVCGSYTTPSEAYNQLQNLRDTHEQLSDAWVYKITN